MEEIKAIHIVNKTPLKKVKFKDTKENIFKPFNNKYIYIPSMLILIMISQYIIQNILKNNKKEKKQRYDINFKYEDFDKKILTDKIKKNSGWMLNEQQAYFINGIIRKNKPKNCLEVGVANGGSSILILNAIKEIENSVLVSLDLNSELFIDRNKKTGYRVKQFFPELINKWKLYTGEQPHIFLDKLQLKFDFVFLDTAHISPGEIITSIFIKKMEIN